MSLMAQAHSNAYVQIGLPFSIGSLMSATAEQMFPDVVKWVPLSVRMVWTLRDGFDRRPQEVPGDPAGCLLTQRDECELGGPINATQR